MRQEHLSILTDMIKANSKVLCVDGEEELNKALKAKKCDMRIRKRDSLGSISEKFDYIIITTQLNKLQNPAEIVEQCSQSLSKDGSILFTATDMTHLGSRIGLIEDGIDDEDKGALFDVASPVYSRQMIESLFGQADCGIDKLFWADGEISNSELADKFNLAGLKQPRQFFDEGRRIGPTTYLFIGSAKKGYKQPESPKLPLDISGFEAVQVQRIYEYEIAQQRQLLESEIDRLQHKEASLISSLSWRLTVPLRLANGIAIKLRQRLRLIIHGAVRDPRLRPGGYSHLSRASKLYRQADQNLQTLESQAKAAAIVHLYYTDSWSVLSAKLQRLQAGMSFDLFVTLPSHNRGFEEQIMQDFPAARIIEVPNRGRDVLPFLRVAGSIKGAGYEYVLKLHSKKSPHRDDGNIWFNDMLENLVPEDEKTLRELEKTLQDSKTGVVGPQGQYTSLLVNYEGNSFFFLKVMRQLYGREFTKRLNTNKDDYGFFAGTMFWIRFDALTKVLTQNFGPVNFQHEGKHIDGTIAHALERVFCVVPEIEGRMMYEVGDKGIKQLVYESAEIPEWSNLHPSNRKTNKR